MARWLVKSRPKPDLADDDDPPATPAVVTGEVTFSVAVIRRWWRGEPAKLFGLRFSIDVNGDED